MRKVVIASVLAVFVVHASAFAEDAKSAPAAETAPSPAERTFADGKLSDPYWTLTYELPGLTESKMKAGPDSIFEGKAGEITVQIVVQEGDRARTTAEWRDLVKQAWTAKKRDMREPAAGDKPVHWESFVEKSQGGFDRHHGYAFHPRGLQVFIVHATASAKTETSAAEIAKALGALKLGEDKGGILMAQTSARASGKPVDSVEVLLDAGQRYLTPRSQGGGENFVLAERAFGQALMKAETSGGEIGPEALHTLYEMLGMATLMQRKSDGAIRWFGKAVEIGEKSSSPDKVVANSTYNLACAYSVGGKIDDAFAALERAFAKNPDVVETDHLNTDPDLDNLRKDPRWEAFVAKQSGGGMK